MFLTICLLLIYGSTTLGATIHLHYCMQKFVGWSLTHEKTNKCGKCGMKEKKSGCCKNEHKQIKAKIGHHSNVKLQVTKSVKFEKISTTFVENQSALQSVSQVVLFASSPPLISGIRLNVLYCVYKI